jgi:ATPase family associated with various cellular activities (AAA)
MQNQVNLNININKDDHEINDYLFCWHKLGNRPNKISIFGHYQHDTFHKYISTRRKKFQGIFTEVVPAGEDYIINEKCLVELTGDIFISYIQYDKQVPETLIGDISLFYLNKSVDNINIILSELQKLELQLNQDSFTRMNTLNFTPSAGLELDSLDILDADYENIDNYYEDDVIKKSDKLIKYIKKNKKGLSVIYGERGCGKTTLINHICSNIDKMVIFIPCSMFETTILNPEFRNFIKRYRNSVLVIDDSELYFSELYSKSNIFTNNILQLVDGFQSDNLDLNIIVCLNVSDINQVDHELLDCNNISDVIEVTKLSPKRATELSNHLGSKSKIKEKMRLVDVLKKKKFKLSQEEIGF